MKKITATVATLCLVGLLGQNAFAEKQTQQDNTLSSSAVIAKAKLIESHKNEYNPSLTESQKKDRITEMKNKITELTAKSLTPDELAKQLSKYGLYKLDSPTETSQDDGTVQPMSQPADTTLNAVQIYADGTTHNWYVIGSGQWNNNNWLNDDNANFLVISVKHIILGALIQLELHIIIHLISMEQQY